MPPVAAMALECGAGDAPGKRMTRENCWHSWQGPLVKSIRESYRSAGGADGSEEVSERSRCSRLTGAGSGEPARHRGSEHAQDAPSPIHGIGAHSPAIAWCNADRTQCIGMRK